MTIFFIIFYIFNYDSENKVRRELALISLALAASFKLTPAVLGILLIYNKQWKEVVRVIIYGLIFGIVPFLFFHGGLVNIGRMFHNASLNVDKYVSTEGATLTAFTCSAWCQGDRGFNQGYKEYNICCSFTASYTVTFL